ncbi:MAG: helix-turn-helix transcriptional regulator [Firmicutes bacterium]|nr:helix-turn-helix transcriptional regulator [Bacillota bacterium]
MKVKLNSQLKKHRVLAELTQDELAAKVGVRRETIVHLEAGRYNPSLKLAWQLAKVLNTGIEEIFWYDEDSES